MAMATVILLSEMEVGMACMGGRRFIPIEDELRFFINIIPKECCKNEKKICKTHHKNKKN